MNVSLSVLAVSLAPPSPGLRKQLAARIRLVEPALRQRLGREWKADEIDLVFAHYLFGLVDGTLPNGNAENRLALLRDLARAALDPNALECALHTKPPSAVSGESRAAQFAQALASAEDFGRREAQAALAPAPNDVDQPI